MKIRSSRNQTLTCTNNEISVFSSKLLHISDKVSTRDLENTTIQQDFLEVIPYFSSEFVDLLVLDPPYNLSKDYNGDVFSKMGDIDYCIWFDNM